MYETKIARMLSCTHVERYSLISKINFSSKTNLSFFSSFAVPIFPPLPNTHRQHTCETLSLRKFIGVILHAHKRGSSAVVDFFLFCFCTALNAETEPVRLPHISNTILNYEAIWPQTRCWVSLEPEIECSSAWETGFVYLQADYRYVWTVSDFHSSTLFLISLWVSREPGCTSKTTGLSRHGLCARAHTHTHGEGHRQGQTHTWTGSVQDSRCLIKWNRIFNWFFFFFFKQSLHNNPFIFYKSSLWWVLFFQSLVTWQENFWSDKKVFQVYIDTRSNTLVSIVTTTSLRLL